MKNIYLAQIRTNYLLFTIRTKYLIFEIFPAAIGSLVETQAGMVETLFQLQVEKLKSEHIKSSLSLVISCDDDNDDDDDDNDDDDDEILL